MTAKPKATKATPQRIGYARISTSEQRIDRQILGLRDQCDRLFIEEGSAVAAHRPVFEEALTSVRTGDTIVIYDLDRAFRSTIEAIMTAECLRERGVHLKIISLNIDTATAEGELYFTLLSAMAQFERRILSRRTKEGMEAARKRGAKIGRPRKLDEETIARAYRYVSEDGYPAAYVSKLLGISRTTLYRAFKYKALNATT